MGDAIYEKAFVCLIMRLIFLTKASTSESRLLIGVSNNDPQITNFDVHDWNHVIIKSQSHFVVE